jgi:8-oxo-dGTP pyrophosphatase MutT (NUDIX family)
VENGIVRGLIINERRLLVIREEGEVMHKIPGGSIEVGENPEQALIRELGEELGISITTHDFSPYESISTQLSNTGVTNITFFLLQSLFSEFSTRVFPSPLDQRWITIETMGSVNLGNITRDFVLRNLRENKMI